MYARSPIVGSPSRLYDLLLEASTKMPIADNYQGSYLTFKSVNGLVFAIDLLVAGFSTVWLDQAYWQRAIASRPETSVKAYLFGGIAWYGIPFSFATIMGLGCAALSSSASFPTYPNPLSAEQNGAGLSSPATAIALLGKGGAGLMLLLLFMAVTSSTSAELIAVSSLLTFDIYKTYMRPKATSNELVRISHLGIVIYALALATFCAILNAVNVNLTWLLTVLGVIVGGASVPNGLILLWPRMSTLATILAPWTGLCFGMIAWFVTTSKRSGAITVLTTGDAINAVAGNIASWAGGALVAVMVTYIAPHKFSTDDPIFVARVNKINGIPGTPFNEKETTPTKDRDIESAIDPSTGMEKPPVPSPTDSNTLDGNQPSVAKPAKTVPTGNHVVDFLEAAHIEPMDPVLVKRGTRLAVGFNALFLCVALLLVPFTLFGTEYIFSRSFFTGWCVVSFMWCWVSMIICVIWPVWESRKALYVITSGILRDVTRKGNTG
ncbi:urea active transporter [Lambiella insularis]|nr:urea active transporter [Lambiella insularis]